MLTFDTILELKTKLDCYISDLALQKLNHDRFGICIDKLDIKKLDLLKDYQKILNKLVLQQSLFNKTSTEIVENIILINTNTNQGQYVPKTTKTNFLGNCVKEVIVKTPSFDSLLNKFVFTETTTYEQDADCSNIQSDITCLDKILKHIRNL